MKQPHEQPHNNQVTQNQTAIVQTYTPPTLAGLAKNRIIDKHGMTEQEWALYDAEFVNGRYKMHKKGS